MATALAVQLAKIAAKSNNSLDLRAQRKSHSQSLIFDPAVAAIQDFDTIYQLCLEGFQELCSIDERFHRYRKNLFSEQSKVEDRTQMTASQSAQLDAAIESFLSLVGARLLLKPAVKAVEWLVRRFRVHEYNTISLVMACLPYHSTPLFANMLSIMPKNLPSVLKFLSPYRDSVALPPRHAIVYSMTNSEGLSAALNNFVLKACKAGFQNRTMLSFWSGIITEAVAGNLDRSSSGRLEAQNQKQEKVLLQILPVLNEGLSMKKIPELRIGCYMILTVAASKATINDHVMDALMDAVVQGWTHDTTHAGLICLAVLAQRKQAVELSSKVFKAVLSLERVDDDLLVLSAQYNVGKLSLGLILGILGNLKENQVERGFQLIRSIMESGVMNEVHVAHAISSILSVVDGVEASKQLGGDVLSQITDLILSLSDSKRVGTVINDILKRNKTDLDRLEMKLSVVLPSDPTPDPSTYDQMETERLPDESSELEQFETAVKIIPTRTAYETSFLSHSESYVLDSLSQAFHLASSLPGKLEAFSDLPVLRKSLATTEPLFLSFYVKIWCGRYSTPTRVAALAITSAFLKRHENSTDFQFLLPYVLYALADPAKQVRKAAADLVLALSRHYSTEESSEQNQRSILGRDDVYGSRYSGEEIAWLSFQDAARFVHECLIPILEECRLDSSYVTERLVSTLTPSHRTQRTKTTAKEMKSSTRSSIFNCMSTHVINTPLYNVKNRLLHILNHIEKAGNISRSKALLPLLRIEKDRDGQALQRLCERDGVDSFELIHNLVAIVLPTDKDGIHMLQEVVSSEKFSCLHSLRLAAFQRFRKMWSSMKNEAQMVLAMTLLDSALDPVSLAHKDTSHGEAADFLRSVSLPENVFLGFLDSLPRLSETSDQPSGSKRRRTSDGQTSVPASHAKGSFQHGLRMATFVIDLIEESKSMGHTRLMAPLFDTLADTQQCRGQRGEQLAYVQSSILGSLLAIVDQVKISQNIAINSKDIRTDVLVECMRVARSPQIQRGGLLLLTSLADIVPDMILNTVMPMLTFMSDTLLRQPDDFSASVVQKTLEGVIPPLMGSLRQQKARPATGASQLLTGALQLLVSFVGAFEHIQPHRRIGLFRTFVDKLGADQFLFVVLAMLLDKHVMNKEARKFAADLASHYPATLQLRSIHQYLGLVKDALLDRPAISAQILEVKKDEDIYEVLKHLMSLLPLMLSSRQLSADLARVLDREDEESALARSTYSALLETVVMLATRMRSNKVLSTICEQIVGDMLGILTMSEFLKALRILLTKPDERTQSEALRTLESRIDRGLRQDSQTQDQCLEILPAIATIIDRSSDPQLQLIAVHCSDRIIEKYGKRNPDVVASSARIISSPRCLDSRNSKLQTYSFLYLATTVEVLQESIIPIIPGTLSIGLDILATVDMQHDEGIELHNSVGSFFCSVLLYIPWIMSGPHLDRLFEALHELTRKHKNVKSEKVRHEILQIISKRVEASVLFAALQRTWNNSLIQGPQALQDHINLLAQAIERQPKSVIAKNTHILQALFLKGFDIRYGVLAQTKYEDQDFDLLEERVINAACNMIAKLNDKSFRSIFIALMEQASNAPSKKLEQLLVHRKVTWYKFLFTFFDWLKAIVTNYIGLVLDDIVKSLDSVPTTDNNTILLWKCVLRVLQPVFEYDDNDYFQSPSHLNMIVGPLLNQLVYNADLPIENELIPAITGLAVAADSAENHKVINSFLLNHMRSDKVATRLAAVHCQQKLTERLGEEWLALLPEMLPIISELQEDDDEIVEKETQKWIGKMEGVLGESLDSMLQ